VSTTLKRPMFRRGGSAGEGITSGLAPRQGYADKGWVKQVLPTEEEISTLQKLYGPRPRSTNLNDFLINFGLDIASRPPQGGLLSTAAASAKDPFAQFQQRKMYEEETPRKERGEIIGQIIAGKAEALAGDSAASIFKDEKMAARARDAYTAQVAHNDKWNPEWETMTAEELKENQDYRDWENERRLIDSDISIFEEETGIDMETALGGKERIREIQDAWATKLKQSEEMMTHPDTGEEIEEAEFYTDPRNRGYLYQKVYQMMLDFVAQEKRKRRQWKGIYKTYESGGRAGYQQGTLVEQEDVNIQTPRGDVSMQETVEEGAEPDQLSYEELRARLPVEITDDIIRLMVNSAEALTDFAQIQTQQDVDNFNAKYGVNLVLPSEA
jgi:hypothetical protein